MKTEEEIVSLLLNCYDKRGESCFIGDSLYAPYFSELVRMGVPMEVENTPGGAFKVCVGISGFDRGQVEGLEGKTSFKFIFEGNSGIDGSLLDSFLATLQTPG
jgi:hypothetical protein